MKILDNFMAFCVVLFVGCSVASKMGYNLCLQSNKKWVTFVLFPLKYILNMGRTEK